MDAFTTLNTTSKTCWQLVGETDFLAPSFLSKTIVLTAINLVVLGGNLLVIVSVFLHRSLHTTTNYLITSLAFSDFLIGLCVLPFSISQEIFDSVWPFGRIMCELYMAIDVWLCTASIYNLVAISFDRYMAVTRPIHYKLISSRKTGKYLVAAAWLVSFGICAPPLIMTMLKEDSSSRPTVTVFNMPNSESVDVDASLSSLIDSLAHMARVAATSTAPEHNHTFVPPADMLSVRVEFEPNAARASVECSCSPMDNNDAYIIYSAMGSFVMPLFAIIVLNWGIFKNARIAGQIAIERKPSNSRSPSEGAQGRRVMAEMRVHRGGRASQSNAPVSSSNNYNATARRISTQTMPTPRRVSTTSSSTTIVPSIVRPPADAQTTLPSDAMIMSAALMDERVFGGDITVLSTANGSLGTVIGNESAVASTKPDMPPLLERQSSMSNPEVNSPTSRKKRTMFANGANTAYRYRAECRPFEQIELSNGSLNRTIDSPKLLTGSESPVGRHFTSRIQRQTTAAGGSCIIANDNADVRRLRSLSGGVHHQGRFMKHSRQSSSPAIQHLNGVALTPTRRESKLSMVLDPSRRLSRMVIDKISTTFNRHLSMREMANQEARVARTILIVVGCFVVCWVPFTTIYILQIGGLCTFDNQCISPNVFFVAFWLGYFNSTLNPIIYALFSRDLRRAFKNTLKRMDARYWCRSADDEIAMRAWGDARKSSRSFNNSSQYNKKHSGSLEGRRCNI